MKKKTIDIKIDEKEPVVEESQSRKDFEALLKVYKEKNPEKYEIKKKNGEFERYLKKLK